MKYKKLKLSAVLLLSLGLTGLQAQEAIPATGGNASGSGGSASYSAGQVFYTINTGTNSYSIAEGVQQPFEISVVSGIKHAKGINLSVSTYPNPVADFLILEIDFTTAAVQTRHALSQRYIASIYDTNGNLIKSEIITGDKTEINMQNFVPATYFLKVMRGKEEIKSFKIIKY